MTRKATRFTCFVFVDGLVWLLTSSKYASWSMAAMSSSPHFLPHPERISFG
jgi:hypothetical protein